MRIQGHIAAGFIASQGLLATLPVTPNDRLSLLLLGSLAGGLPDLDALYYFKQKKALTLGDDFTHHRWVSHTLPPYLFLALILVALGRVLSNSWLQQASLFIAIPTSLHLFMDMIGSGDGIMIAWPFSRRMVGIGKLNAHGMSWKRKYEASPYVYIEHALFVFALILLAADLGGLV